MISRRSFIITRQEKSANGHFLCYALIYVLGDFVYVLPSSDYENCLTLIFEEYMMIKSCSSVAYHNHVHICSIYPCNERATKIIIIYVI